MRLTAGSCALVLLLALAGCGDPKQQEAEHLDKAIAFEKAGDDVKAMVELKNVLQLNPKNPEALYHSGLIAERAQQWPQAFSAYQAAVAAKPDHVPALIKVATLQLASGDLPAVEKTLATVEPLATGNPEVMALRAAVMLRGGDLQRAEDLAREALAKAPGQESAIGVVVGVLNARGRTQDAIAFLDQAIQASPKAGSLVALKVATLQAVNDVEGTRHAYDQLVASDPGNDGYRLALADFEYRSGDKTRARTILEEVAGRTKDVKILVSAQLALAQMAIEAGDLAGANARIDTVLAKDPNNGSANFLRASILMQQKNVEEAIRTIRLTLRDAPNWTAALKLLAVAQQQSGNGKLAIDTLRKVVQLTPTDGKAIALLASLLTQSGDTDGALKEWNRLEAVDPTQAALGRAQLAIQQKNWSGAQADIDKLMASPEHQWAGALLSGNLSIAQNQYDQGRQWFAKAAELQPGVADSSVTATIQSFLAQNDIGGALGYLRQKTQATPDDAVPHGLLGEMLLRQGDATGVAQLERAISLQPAWNAPYQVLSRYLVQQGKTDEAAQVIQKGLAVKPGDPVLTSDLGSIQLAAGQYDQAIATYGQVLDNDVAANNYAALIADYAYADPDKLKKAQDAMSRFKATREPVVLDTIGWLAYRAGDYQAAVANLQQAASRVTGEPQFHYHLGMALYRTGQNQKALAELEKALATKADFPGIEEARATRQLLVSQPAAPAKTDATKTDAAKAGAANEG